MSERKMITLYTAKTCSMCGVMKRFLEEESVALERQGAYEVVDYDDAPERFEEADIMGTPTFVRTNPQGEIEMRGALPRAMVRQWLEEVSDE